MTATQQARRPNAHRQPPARYAPRRRPLAAAAAGFTLIEVLISIIILALGLLGIGVVFPVVIRQQRISTDEVAGVLMARNVADAIQTRLAEDTVWWKWRGYMWGGGTDPYANPTTPSVPYTRAIWSLPEIDESTGDMELTPSTNPGIVLAADRLSFSASSRVDGPYVWDMAVQPVYDGDSDILNDHVRICLFVRRIDARTRDGGLPVAVDADGLPAVDRRAGQSGLAYAQPVVMDASIQPLPGGGVDRDHLSWNGVNISDENWAIVSQAGQKIVDAFGNVYTVQRGSIDENGYKRVRVTPPIPASITEVMIPRMRMSIVTTPQPAVAVYTFEVTP